MRKSCAANADSCDGSAKVPVMGCIAMLAAAAVCAVVSRLGLGLAAAAAAAAAAAMSSGSSLNSASLTKTTTRMYSRKRATCGLCVQCLLQDSADKFRKEGRQKPFGGQT